MFQFILWDWMQPLVVGITSSHKQHVQTCSVGHLGMELPIVLTTSCLLKLVMELFIVILGATKMRRATLVWSEEYGTRIPIIMNAMTYNAFRQLRQHLHFVDNSKVNKR